MSAIYLGLVGAIKNILLKCLSQSFFEWALLWAAEMLVSHTKTPHDDKFFMKIKEVYEQGKQSD